MLILTKTAVSTCGLNCDLYTLSKPMTTSKPYNYTSNLIYPTIEQIGLL